MSEEANLLLDMHSSPSDARYRRQLISSFLIRRPLFVDEAAPAPRQ